MVILLNKIYCPEEQQERAAKALRLNGGPDYNPTTGRLQAAFSTKKPTIRIKRLGFSGQLKGVSSGPKLKGASSHGYGTSGNQSFHEHLASCELCRTVLQIEKANKGLRLATGL